jgi:dethiobiotin synthetase
VKVLFVTGAGTEIGKTYVTCLLARQLRVAGHAVRAFKPVATGMAALADPAFQHSDTAQLLAAQGSPCDETTIAACTPWHFAAPLSPDMAATVENRRLELIEIATWARGAIQQIPADTIVLIEGVGGVMSPIACDALNIDLIAALACPAILVGGKLPRRHQSHADRARSAACSGHCGSRSGGERDLWLACRFRRNVGFARAFCTECVSDPTPSRASSSWR